MAPVRISSGPEPKMMFGQNSSSLVLHQIMFGQNSSSLVLHQMMSAQNSSGLAPQYLKMLEHSSSSLGLHCQKTFKQISSNLVSQMSRRRLLASLQAPFFKEKKVVKWINVDQLSLNVYETIECERDVKKKRLTDPSLLGVVKDWKGKPSLRSTEVAKESYLPHFS
ncbi:hypothetical protein Tco_1278430 [Tanacetum coccineum]